MQQAPNPQLRPQIRLVSRSPRRRELLGWLVGADRIVIEPPPSAVEAQIAPGQTWSALQSQLLDIARSKMPVRSSASTVAEDDHPPELILSADTEIVVSEGELGFTALGQPPAGPAGWPIVSDWFRKYYAGRIHWAMTAICLRDSAGREQTAIDVTAVQMRADCEDDLAWYLQTGESAGKAGGYALQGLGSLFVERVEGSLTNVIGLPLETVRNMLLAWDPL